MLTLNAFRFINIITRISKMLIVVYCTVDTALVQYLSNLHQISSQ